ncbi:MAG: esterase-like activity of phytase family protein [Alphaproteobacteria bacterium]
MRKPILLAVTALLVLMPTHAGLARDITIEVTPIPLNERDPGQSTIGSLTYLGGLELNANEWRFGGISGLAVSPDGGQLLALTDRASWLAFKPVLKGGRLTGLADSQVRFVRNKDGGKWDKEEQDSEAVAVSPEGYALVSFERNHRIMRFDLADPNDVTTAMASKAAPGPAIPGLRYLPNNGGLESLVFLDANRLLAVTEQAEMANGHLSGWLIQDGEAKRLGYRTRHGYVPTDMTLLPNGDVLTVERHFTLLTGVSARLCIIARDSIEPGAVLECDQIAELSPPVSVDNMEAIAAYENEAGETIIFLASDDNFSSWRQRTLLMMFRLDVDVPGSD